MAVKRHIRLSLPCLSALLVAWSSASVAFDSKRRSQQVLTLEDNHFDWSSIKPSRQLAYTSCFDGLECARLDVPLDWNSTGEERETHRAAIAIVRLPAKVPVTDRRYGGAILVNPGGPGEPGTDHVVSRGRSIQTIVDADIAPADLASELLQDAKYFDLIGFDPRGVKDTTPRLKCFPDAFSQQMWLMTLPEWGTLFDSDSSLGLEWARTEALGLSCSSADRSGDMLRYSNTPQVVEDMLEIVERHGQWRDHEAQRLLGQTADVTEMEEPQIVRARTSWRKERESLNYWGESYGTLIGQTFAAMHPDRVGRLVIDGVVDPDDYYQGTWLVNLEDSDKVMSKLSEYCFEAGPGACPLYTGESWRDVEDLVTKLVFGLKSSPIAVPLTDGPFSSPIVVSFGDFYLRAIGAMAFPFGGAEHFFELLAELQKGNVTEIATFKESQLDEAASLASCRTSATGCLPERYFGILWGTPVIECMDSAFHRNKSLTKDEFSGYLEELTSQSKWFSLAWARHKMSCIGIEGGPAWRFEGPIAGNTKHPLLIIGNTHDTVTPLQNARRVSTLFPGSVLLQQDSEGHCSHASPSTCTARLVREYFQTGGLPKPGTVCQPDWRPFVGRMHTSEVDGTPLWQALVDLAKSRSFGI